MEFIDEIDIKGKKVLFRFDFNVPLNGLKIVDDTRIRAVLPTINYALDEGATVIITSHLGRPKGKVVPELSLIPVAIRLSRLLDKQVEMAGDCVGEGVRKLIEGMIVALVVDRPTDVVHPLCRRPEMIHGPGLVFLCKRNCGFYRRVRLRAPLALTGARVGGYEHRTDYRCSSQCDERRGGFSLSHTWVPPS